ncbi:MAG TPA: ribose-5-phosphate isomerase RpiA [Cyclobacteriaceae bacterium]|nr:ribose-5-phosphate isomerase RpiA [Cyclobacteriaceae bacterium]
MIINAEHEKKLAAKEAVKLIRQGQVVGLGTGSTAYFAILEIADMIRNGLQIKAVPTSVRSRELAEQLNIPLIDIHTIDSIDITIDGADEFTRELNLIKGGGGALLREKVVAAMTREQIIIADSAKKVDKLGKFHLPVEVIPFAASYVMNRLRDLKGAGTIRQKDGSPFLTDQGNFIIDTDFGIIDEPAKLAEKLDEIVGLVEHGLFINLAHKVIMGQGDKTVIFNKPGF